MAIVAPINENSVRLQPLTGERLQAGDFGGQEIARGAAQLGNAITDVAITLRDKYDEAAVKQALNASQMEVLETKKGLLARQGAQAPGVLTDAQKRFGEIKGNYGKALAGPRQRAMFADVFDRRAASDYEDIGNHENKQVDIWHRESAATTAEVSRNSAIAEFGVNPEKAEAFIATGKAQLAIMFPGSDAATLKLKGDKFQSETYLATAKSFAEQGDEGIVKAEQFIKERSGKMIPDDVTAFFKAYQPQLEEVADAEGFGKILSGEAIGSETDPTNPGVPVKPQSSAVGTTAELVTGRKGVKPVGGGSYGAAREGTRRHAGIDIPLPEGTPLYPPASGVVVKNFRNNLGGWSVVIRHPDGRETGYADLRARSPVAVGETVERDTVIGAAGSSGSNSTGSHAHIAVRNAQGNPVDPMTQKWDNMPSKARSSRPADTGDREDLAALRERTRQLAEKEGWSDRKYERMLKRVDAWVSKQDQLRERAFDDADERVATQVDKLGDGFTSITQIDTSGLRPGAIDTLRKRAEANRDGSETAKSGSDRYFALLTMATDPARQEDFMKLPPTQLMQGVSKGEYARLRTMQIEAKNAPPGKGIDTGRVWSEVNRVLPAKTKDGKPDATRDKERNMLLDRLLVEFRAAGREIPDEELMGLTRRLVQPVLNPDTGEVKPHFLQKGGRVVVGVPASFAAGVNARRKALNLPPYDDATMRRYWTARGAPAQ